MTQDDAIKRLCEEVMRPVANHVGCGKIEEYCICDLDKREWDRDDDRIDPELIDFVIAAVQDKIQRKDEDQVPL